MTKSTTRTCLPCPKCQKEVSRSNHTRHVEACTGPKKGKYDDWKIGPNQYKHPKTGYIGTAAEINFYCINLQKKESGISSLDVWNKKRKEGEVQSWNSGLSQTTHPQLEEKLCAGGRAFREKVEEGFRPAIADMWSSEEARKTKSEWRKKLHRENPESHPNRKLANNRKKMSYPEQLVFDLLTKSKIQFDHNKYVAGYYPDFVIGSIIIEVDGIAWHNQEKDRDRDQKLEEHGYTVYRFPVGSHKDLIVRVEKFLKEKGLLS